MARLRNIRNSPIAVPGRHPNACRTWKLTPAALGYSAENRAKVTAIGSEASDRITQASSEAGPA